MFINHFEKSKRVQNDGVKPCEWLIHYQSNNHQMKRHNNEMKTKYHREDKRKITT